METSEAVTEGAPASCTAFLGGEAASERTPLKRFKPDFIARPCRRRIRCDGVGTVPEEQQEALSGRMGAPPYETVGPTAKGVAEDFEKARQI